MTNGTPDTVRISQIKRSKKDLRNRAWVSYLFSFVYLTMTFIVLYFAYERVYFGTFVKTAEDMKKAQQITQSDEARDIRFYDVATSPVDGTVIAIGSDSSIRVFSHDGKIKYDLKGVDGTKSDLRSIAFSGDGKTAIAAGDDGVILVSTDRGKSWRAADSVTEKDFTRVALSRNGNIAIAVGDHGLIRVSRNRGKTWSRTEPSNITPEHINDIVLNDDGTTAVAVADNEVALFSRNKGGSWENPGYGEGKLDFQAVALHGDTTAVVVGDDGSILIFCDKGETFSSRESVDKKKDRRSDFYDIAISGDGKTAIAVGRKGVVWTLSLAEADWCPGKGWTKRESKVGESLESVALNHGGSVAVAVGRDGTILVSEDKGKAWQSRGSGTASDLYRVTLGLDGRSAVVVGKDSTILWLESSGEKLLGQVASLGASQKSDGEEGEQDKSTSDNGRPGSVDFYVLFDRAGIVLILLFMIPYLMGLARYHIQLAAFYHARRDALQLTAIEALPQPGNVDELEQMMYALSPDGVDFKHSPKSVIDLLAKLARAIRRDSKNSAT